MKAAPLLIYASTLLFGSAIPSFASEVELLFDRGLPTANINNAAGEKRSNVVWAANPTVPEQLVGDDFILQGQASYTVTKIRVWSTDKEALSLYAGRDGDTIKPVSISCNATRVFYQGQPDTDKDYQGYLGINYYQLYQLDFEVDLTIKGGERFDFFLDGPLSPFLHSSNKQRSGSTQKHADGLLLFFTPSNGQIFASATGDNGWDKDSDANVQVFGTQNKPNKK